MPHRRPTMAFEEWEAERISADPQWERHLREFSRTKGTHRKVPLLVDENIEAEFVDELRGIRDFRVRTLARRASDEAVWAEARKLRLILVTADPDFWNDHSYPVRDSPGVVIVSGRTYSEKAEAFAVAVVHWAIQWRYRIEPASLGGMKIKATRSGTSAKWWNGNSSGRHEYRSGVTSALSRPRAVPPSVAAGRWSHDVQIARSGGLRQQAAARHWSAARLGDRVPLGPKRPSCLSISRSHQEMGRP